MYVLYILISALIAWIIAVFLHNVFFSPLKSFPGPFYASFTNIWRFVKTTSKHVHIINADLHRKHGPVVRVAPNVLSVSDPAYIPVIYGTGNPWKKSRMYEVQQSMNEGKSQPNLFSICNEEEHKEMARPVYSYFSNSNTSKLEPHLDYSIHLLIHTLGRKCGEVQCDIAHYFLLFSWDAMGNVTFGEPLGFLKGSLPDLELLLRDSDRDFDYFAMVSQMPGLHYLLKTNPIARRLRPPQLGWAVELSCKYYAQRRGMQNHRSLGDNGDFLDKYLEAQRKYPELITDDQMISYLLTNTVAGSHPIAYTLTALIYYVSKTDGVYEKLREEIDRANFKFPVSWRDAKSLHYLEAVIRETIRIHPAFALILERVVPKGGFVLNGRSVPGGTIVGINPWVVNRNEKFFGSPDQFIPERWLPDKGESQEKYQERLKRMESIIFSFGGGPRVCLGRHIADVTLLKVAASLFSAFDIKLAEPNEEWKVTNSWVLRTEKVSVSLQLKSNTSL